MPAASMDTFLGCSLMILLVLSSMIGASKLVMPYSDQLSRNSAERYQKLFQYILTSTGTPSNWGSDRGVVPTSFGLAPTNLVNSYELDIDKISRLNDRNTYVLTYEQIIESLGMQDVTLRIEVDTLFSVSTTLTNSSVNGNQTIYTFEVVAKKSEIPVQASLRCYAFVHNYVQSINSSTSSSGTASLNVTLPNSINGTALFIVLARACSQVFAFDVYRFIHITGSTLPDGSFLRASPLNYTAYIDLLYSGETITSAKIFSYNFNFSMTQTGSGNQTAQYSIPRLLDPGPTILALTGINSSLRFAEWVFYPQLPLGIGISFDDLDLRSNIIPITSICIISFALYQITAKFGGPR
jgi:hypothetical protein